MICGGVLAGVPPAVNASNSASPVFPPTALVTVKRTQVTDLFRVEC